MTAHWRNFMAILRRFAGFIFPMVLSEAWLAYCPTPSAASVGW
jgi:hypothetical protein